METFLDEIWGATHYHVKRRCAGYFDSLLPGPSAVEGLLEHVQPEPSAVRLIRGGEDKDHDAYRLADGSLDIARVRDGFADGYTIILNGLERYVRTIASLSHSIEVELNFPTRVNAYVTPPESTGFVPHYDPHDVLVLQIQGSKTWHLSNDPAVPPHEIERREGVGTDGLSSLTAVHLEAGDVLYLPRGQVHAAETHLEPSVHLTVGIHAPTVLTLVTHVLHSLSLRDDRVHARLSPRHLDDAAIRASLGDLLRDTIRSVEDPSVLADGLGTMEEVLVRRGRCPPVASASNAVGIDGQTRVMKYQPLYSRVVTVAGGVALQFAQLSITVAPDHEAAMVFVSNNTDSFRVRDLPGLTAAQQMDLARTLIVSGFLVRLPED
ncbi:cupin domain-containing protein [Mycobacterium sp.]|uniref:cupin domain-containing protein n=1 Tax=Mycobacterium sp. TaxID=1785 RepID=UPI003D6B3F89